MLNSDILSCAFAGYRLSGFHFGSHEEHPDCVRLKRVLRNEILALIQNGVSCFLSGMAPGADIWAAEIVLDLKGQGHGIQLICVLPCETQADYWNLRQRERYFTILEACDQVIYISRCYTGQCMFQRNRYLVDHSNYLIAVYDGNCMGFAAYTVNYARKRNHPVILIDPNTMKTTPG